MLSSWVRDLPLWVQLLWIGSVYAAVGNLLGQCASDRILYRLLFKQLAKEETYSLWLGMNVSEFYNKIDPYAKQGDVINEKDY